jgi:hypothetical protein
MTWVRRPGHPLADEFGMVDKELAGEPVQARSDLPFPMVISDYVEVQSQVDGKTYTSKAALRQSYRAQGYVEVGNEWLNKEPVKTKPKADRKAIRNAIGKARQRVGI